MKKIILSIVTLIFIALVAVNINLGLNINGGFSKLGLKDIVALGGCETTVEQEGPIYIITVCNRATDEEQYVSYRLSCGIASTTTCTFTNMGR